MKYIIMTSLLFMGCSHAPTIEKNCCQRLDVRTAEMSRYHRFCKVIAIGVLNQDPKSLNSKHVPGLLVGCRFVFGVNTNADLVAPFTAQAHPFPKTAAREIEMGWMTPLDCDPAEPACEEF
jgi:hypothetical protein|tara:strand:- start:605 stop:967 length:363 start_codon:yes stop_codon:yes gene_type:complete